MKVRFRCMLIALGATLVLASLAFVTGAVAGQGWPPEKMTIVLSHGVGSGQDRFTRILGPIWEEYLGTKFIYLNKKGGSGRIGYDYFVHQPKDGTVILSSNQTSASIMFSSQKPKWDWERDIYPMGIFCIDPGAIFTFKESPFKTLPDLINAAKKKKKIIGISYWSSPDNLLLHQIMKQTGAQFQIIPFENAAVVMANVLGGHVDASYQKVSNALQAAEEIWFLGISLPENTIPHLTNNAPAIDEALGTDTLPVASFRAIVVHKEFVENYPERYHKLKETFEKAKDDPRYIEGVKRQGADPALIVDWDYEDIMNYTVRKYWRAYEEYGEMVYR